MRLVALAVAVLLAALVGCKKEESVMAPLGNESPTFGVAAEHKTLAGFLVGRWCVVDPLDNLDPNRYYDFKADGSFTYGQEGGDWKGTGTWTASGDSVSLVYVTINSKPMEEFRASYKKDEEGGGQVSVQRALVYDNLFQDFQKMSILWVDENKKHLTFDEPKPVQAAPGGESSPEIEAMLKMGGLRLERMGRQKGT